MPAKKKFTKGESASGGKAETPSLEGALAPQLPEPVESQTTVEEPKESMPEAVQVQKPSHLSAKTIGLAVIILIVLAALASIPAFYFYSQYKAMQTKLNPTAAAQAQITSLISRVGQLIDLPTDETPTVAVVSDKSKLANQSFFAKAENGDQVLIYPKAKKAILYRPSTNKIIEVGPVNIAAAQTPTTAVAGASTSATLSPIPAGVKVALYNGTSTSGLTRKAEPLITATDPSLKVIAKENAAKTDYSSTQVVVLNPQVGTLASKLAASLKGSVSTTFPTGETKTAADILVILGSDFSK